MTKTSIVIPNWNGMSHLPMCLEALSAQTEGDFETLIVDNDSTDESVSYLRDRWPDVRVIQLDSNRGFPAAVNAGVREAKGEYVVLLNNDTKAEPDWLERLVKTMDANPAFSFGSSKLLRFDDPGTIDSAGHTYSLWLGAGDNVGEADPSEDYTNVAWVFGTCAAASIYRRSLFDDIGEFDEDFFFAHEDVEFDLRANVAGHRCLLIPDALVYHKRGGSYQLSAELELMGVRNRLWLAGKNLPPGALALWLGAKVLRVVWWMPARLLRLWSGGTRTTLPHAGGPARVRLRIRDIVRTATEAVIKLPGKRRSARSIRRLRSTELLRVLRSTKSPQTLRG